MVDLPDFSLVRGSVAAVVCMLGCFAVWLHARASRKDRAVFDSLADCGGPARLSNVLRILALALLSAVASAEGRLQSEPPSTSERPLVVVLDVSMSMKAADVQPTRLDEAKRLVRDALPLAAGRRVAMVAFAGDASLVCPLTYDIDALGVLLGETSEAVAAAGPTRAVVAIERAISLLGDGPGDVLVVSDGEFADDPGAALVASAQAAARRHRISVIGVGTESGAPVPRREGGVAREPLELSRLDEAKLRDLALRGGGTYSRATIGAEATLSSLFLRAAPRRPARGVQVLDSLTPLDGVLATAGVLLFIDTWLVWGRKKARR